MTQMIYNVTIVTMDDTRRIIPNGYVTVEIGRAHV